MQRALNDSDVIDRDACSVSHDYLMTCTIHCSDITGDRHIAASGFFVLGRNIVIGCRIYPIRQEGNSMGDSGMLEYNLQDNPYNCVSFFVLCDD